MLFIPCPWCGSRDEVEFRFGGEAHVAYPAEPEALDAAEWAAFLHFRDNPQGPVRERWNHAAGCRRWFNVVRDTRTHAILCVYGPFEEPPSIDPARST